MKRFKDLTQSERILFWDEFPYTDDGDSAFPWGMPWLWAEGDTCEGSTVREMANHWYAKHADEIKKLHNEEGD